MNTTLLNPFEKFKEVPLFITGLLATLAGAYLAYIMKQRYDGVLDVHISKDVQLWEPFADNAINIFALTLTLFIAGKIVNRKTRAIDLLNATMIARIPLYLVPLLVLTHFGDIIESKLDLKNPELSKFTAMDLTIILVMGIVTLALVVWHIWILYNGFRIATNAKKPIHQLFFGGAIVIAEIISKVIINKL